MIERLRVPLPLFGAAAASALLGRACCPPFDLAPIAFVAWVPLLVVLPRVSIFGAAVLGWAQGSLTNLTAFHWTAEPLREVAALSYPTSVLALLALCAWQGLRVALLAAVWRAIAPRHVLARALGFGALLGLVEGLFPMVFPWGTYGFVHAAPLWGQLAAYGGSVLVTAALGSVNEFVASAVASRRHSRRRMFTALGGALVAIGALSVFGSWRMAHVSARVAPAPKTKALVVQAALRPVKLETRDPAAAYRDATLRALRSREHADWVVWPETAIFYSTPPDKLRDLFRNVLLRDRRLGAQAESIPLPLVTGMVLEEPATEAGGSLPEDGATRRYNSVVVADAAGRPVSRYDKTVLVPLGETSGSTGASEAFATGSHSGPLELFGRKLATFVCFEALHAEQVRHVMAGGAAQLLLNPTSDAWFTGSIGPRMHLAFAKVRAVEHERYMLRPTTTGVTALIHPTGKLIWQLPENVATAGYVELAWLDTVTPFTRHGSTPALLGFGSVAALLALAQWLGRRSAASQVRAGPANR